MTKRENLLLKILVILCLCLFFYYSFNFSISLIKESRKNSSKYSQMIEKLKKENFSAEKNEIAIESIDSDIDISEATDLIVKDIKRHGIKPQKYQISSKDNNLIEVVLICSGREFINYLYDIENNVYPYKIKSLNIKNNSENLLVTLKFVLQKSKITKRNSNISKNDCSKLFRPVYKEVPVEEIEQVEEIVIEDRIKNCTNDYTIIGNITGSDGMAYLYLKKKNNSRVIKISPEQILENDDRKYILLVNDDKIQIDKR